MKTRFLMCLLALSQLSLAQWQKIPSPSAFGALFLVSHKDKAYASIDGVLAAGDRESDDRYVFYPVDGGGIWAAASWGEYFVTGTNTSIVTVYSDVSIAEKKISKSIIGGFVQCISPRDNVLLIGTSGSIFRSVDTLKTVQRTGPSAIRGVNGFEYVSSKVFAATDVGIYVSEDEGANWVLAGLSNKEVSAVALFEDTIYAGTSTGLYFSTDDGQSWALHNYFGAADFDNLLVTPGTLLINTEYGLYKKEVGKNIEQAFLGMPGKYTGAIQLGRTSLLSSHGGIVFRDEDKPWKPASAHSGTAARVSHFAAKGNLIIAGTDGLGIFASFDQGETWEMRSPPIRHGAVYAILNCYITDDFWYSSTLKGVYRTADSGVTWVRKNVGLTEGETVASFFLHQGRLWLPTSDGLYYSTDHGDSWQQPASGIEGQVYAVISSKNGKLFASSTLGLYEADAPYENWSLSPFQSGSYFMNLASFSDTLYGTSSGSGAFISRDGGDSWTEINSGLRNKYLGRVVANDSHAVTVNGLGDIYIRVHKEEGWTRFNDKLELFSGINALMLLKDTVYMSAGLNGLYRRPLSDHSPVLGLKAYQLREREASIYPNPASEILNIKNSTEAERIEVTDQNGRTVISTEGSEKMDVRQLDKGLYFVKIYRKDNTFSVEKVIIK